MKKKNGFTLIELLAVIIILAVVLVIAVPKINNVIEDEKQQSLFLTAKSILRNVDYNNIENNSMQKASLASLDINNLSNEDYDINNSYVYMIDNVLYIDLIGINKYSDITLCHINMNDKDYTVYSQCQFANTRLTVNLNGGIIENNPAGMYITNTNIELEEPSKENYDFVRWEKISGNSSLSVNNLIIGTEDTMIIAIWQVKFELSLNLDGGILSSPNPEGRYSTNTIIDLGMPIKENYDFAGWEKISGNSNVSVNSLVMGDEDTVVKALWTPTSYTIEYALNGGNASNPTTYNVESDSITLANPTKAGYTFDGWTGSNGEAKQATVTIQNGSTGNKLYVANWTPSSYTITYNCNGGQGSTAPSTFVYGNTTILTANGCYKITAGSAGVVYYLKGWAKTSDATSVLFTDEQNITNIDQITSNTTLYAIWDTLFTITGTYEVINDSNGDWRVKIKGATGSTYGNASINFENQVAIDAFLVGGGGGGGGSSGLMGGGGGGGYTKTIKNISIEPGNYTIIVGNGGAAYAIGGSTIIFKDTSFEDSISGGYPGVTNGAGGAGGSGGGGAGSTEATSTGGSDGSNGNSGGAGQKTTTREFGETGKTLYSGGGGGSAGYYSSVGGAGGGGGYNVAGTANTGGGGGAYSSGTAAAGGSGIVVIRNNR